MSHSLSCRGLEAMTGVSAHPNKIGADEIILEAPVRDKTTEERMAQQVKISTITMYATLTALSLAIYKTFFRGFRRRK